MRHLGPRALLELLRSADPVKWNSERAQDKTFIPELCGARAELAGCDLSRYDLSGMKFGSGSFANSKLVGANLSQCVIGHSETIDVRGADFQNTKLIEADLSKTCGINEASLAGSDLKGCILPESFSFLGVKLVEQASISSKTNFLLLITTCLLTFAGFQLSDLQILTDLRTPKLPVIGEPIPSSVFFLLAPIILLGLHVNFHLYLQNLWRELDMLPVRFPDGRSQQRRLFPWLWSGPLLGDRSSGPMHVSSGGFIRLRKGMVLIMGLCLPPLVLLSLWRRYLPVNDVLLSTVHAMALSLSVLMCLISLESLISRVERGTERSISPVFRLLIHRPMVSSFVFFQVLFFLSVFFSIGHEYIDDYLIEAYRDDYVAKYGSVLRDPDLVRRSKSASRYLSPFRADIADQEVIQPVEGWKEITLEEKAVAASRLPIVSFVGKQLDGLQARGSFLARADFFGADMRWANLARADLFGACLNYTDFRHVSAKEVDLSMATMVGTRLVNTDLSDGLMRFARINVADTSGVSFRRASLRAADFHGSVVSRADFWGSDLSSGNLRDVDFHDVDFSSSTMVGVALSPEESIMNRVRFNRSDLREASMTIIARDLSAKNANMARSSLVNSDVRNADFGGSRLYRADLDGILGIGTVFDRANLEEAKLVGAILHRAGFNDASLRMADLRYAELVGASFSGASLRRTDLRFAILTDCDDLTLAQLARACLNEDTVLPEHLEPYSEILIRESDCP